MIKITLPAGVTIATTSGPAPESAWLVIAAPAGIEPTQAALVASGAFSVLLTHDRGVAQPDAKGRALAEAALADGCVVAFAFAALADAMACSKWLRKAVAE